MQFVRDVFEPVHVERVFVSGVASITFLASEVVEVTYFANKKQADGSVEREVVARIIWPYSALMAAGALYNAFRRQEVPVVETLPASVAEVGLH